MSAPHERRVEVAGLGTARVWERGEGEPLGFLGPPPDRTDFFERLAVERRVVVPSLPGFEGGPTSDSLGDVADWVGATLDLLDGCDLDGADLIGASVAAGLAAEVAALARSSVERLVLIDPVGLPDPACDETPDTAEPGVRALLALAREGRFLRRLHRVQHPTLLLCGSAIGADAAKRFAKGLGGWVRVHGVEDARRALAAPDAAAREILEFVG